MPDMSPSIVRGLFDNTAAAPDPHNRQYTARLPRLLSLVEAPGDDQDALEIWDDVLGYDAAVYVVSGDCYGSVIQALHRAEEYIARARLDPHFAYKAVHNTDSLHIKH